MKFNILTFLLLFTSNVLAQASSTYIGFIDVISSSEDFIQINPDISIRAGETITIKITGDIDRNHEHYQERRCRYFGLDCWYENRSVPHWVNANQLKIGVSIVDSNGVSILSKTFDGGEAEHTMYASGLDTAAFTEKFKIRAYIAGPDINRTPCSGRPRYCSVGQLKLMITSTDVKKRKSMLENELQLMNKSIPDPVLVASGDFLDTIFIDSPTRKLEVQTIFATELTKWQIDSSRAKSIIDIAKHAISLSDDKDSLNRTKLNNIVLNGYLQAGEYSKITSEGTSALANAKTYYENVMNRGTKDKTALLGALEYSKMLRLNAIGWLEKKARYSSSDIRVALGFLETATGVLGPYALEPQYASMTPQENGNLYQQFADLHLDAARMLTVLRTPPELTRAESLLAESICYKRLADDADWRKNEENIKNCLAQPN